MPLVPAKCTQCGASVKVDSSLAAAVCEHCQTPFIVETAINEYNIENANIEADVVNVYQGSNPKKMIQRARILFEDGDWKQSQKIIDEALQIDPTLGDAYLMLLLMQAWVQSVDELSEQNGPISQLPGYARAHQFADPNTKKKLQAINRELKVKHTPRAEERVNELSIQREGHRAQLAALEASLAQNQVMAQPIEPDYKRVRGELIAPAAILILGLLGSLGGDWSIFFSCIYLAVIAYFISRSIKKRVVNPARRNAYVHQNRLYQEQSAWKQGMEREITTVRQQLGTASHEFLKAESYLEELRDLSDS
jgi:hypothetical protein